MASLADCRDLARKIRSRWKGVLAIDAHTRHYLSSVLGVQSADQIARLLADPQACRSAGLVDLLVSPDQRFLTELDEPMQTADFTGADKDRIAGFLDHPPWWIAVAPGAPMPARRLRVDPDEVRRLIDQIGIGRPIAPEVLQALNVWVLPEDRAAARVCLRQRRAPLSGHQSAFLLRFLERCGAISGGFAEQMAQLLWVMDQLPGDQPVCAAMAQRRALLAAAMDAMADYRWRLTAGAIETMMLRGLRAPYVDSRTTLDTVALMDRFAGALCP
jgi:hypothetical protein